VGSGGKLVLDGTSVALKFQGNVALTAKKFGKLRIAMSVSGDVSQPWDYNVRDLTFPDIWGDPAGKFPVMLDNFVKDFNGTAHAHSQFDAFTELDDDFPWQDVRDKLKDWKLKQMVTGGRFDVDLSQGQLTVLFDILSAGSSTLINTATVTIVSTGSCQVSAGTLYAFAKDPTGTVLPGIMLQVLSTLKMQTMAKLVYKNATITANVEKMIPAIVDFNAAVHDSDNRISHFTSGFNKMLNAGSITFTDLSPLDFIPGNIALIVARFIWDVATA
jgi:hypothetical protein